MRRVGRNYSTDEVEPKAAAPDNEASISKGGFVAADFLHGPCIIEENSSQALADTSGDHIPSLTGYPDNGRVLMLGNENIGHGIINNGGVACIAKEIPSPSGSLSNGGVLIKNNV